MKRTYESIVVFDGSLPDETLTKEQEIIEKFLQTNAEFDKTDVWGKKTLAYVINRKKSGFYCQFIFNGEGDIFNKLNKLYKLNQKILRHITVLYEKKPEVATKVLEQKASNSDLEEGE